MKDERWMEIYRDFYNAAMAAGCAAPINACLTAMAKRIAELEARNKAIMEEIQPTPHQEERAMAENLSPENAWKDKLMRVLRYLEAEATASRLRIGLDEDPEGGWSYDEGNVDGTLMTIATVRSLMKLPPDEVWQKLHGKEADNGTK